MARILVFGDSTSHGKWDYKMGGWVQRLSNFLDEKSSSDPNFDYSGYNLSISGDTTKEILERFEFEAKQRLKEEGGIIIFAIGLNDSCSGRLAVSPAKFRENVQKLIDLARKFSSKIIFIGLTPVEDSKVNLMPWAIDMSYSLERVKKYNGILRAVCNENSVYFIEIFERFVENNYQKLLQDGAHPNSEGHKKIFEIVKDFLIQKKII